MLVFLHGFFVSEAGRGVWFGALQDLTLVCNDVYRPHYLSLSLSHWLSGLFVAGLFVGDVFLFLSLPLRRWETQTPSRRFGVPLVFLRPGRTLCPLPVCLARLLHLGVAPTPVFLFIPSLALGCGRCCWR